MNDKIPQQQPISMNETLPAEKGLGQHWLVELENCDPDRLRQVEGVARSMRKAADRAKASIVSSHFHQFNPYGVSGVLVIQESHLTIHTWPEHRYAAVDIFTCSPDLLVEEAIEQLRKDFAAGSVTTAVLYRGRKLHAGG